MATTTVVTKTTEKKDPAKAMTCAEAVLYYPGTTERQLNRMCLYGKRLTRLYGKDIPEKELAKVLFGKKVGRYWYITLKELDRVFLP